ncbi:hypothetical protein C9J03_06110 [Photobacterium gaetbulicola]|nr:hypothetical protein C9J03_06110 [Photobacterium gaetbulicola]
MCYGTIATIRKDCLVVICTGNSWLIKRLITKLASGGGGVIVFSTSYDEMFHHRLDCGEASLAIARLVSSHQHG